MVFNNVHTHGETQARAGAGWLGGKELFENFLTDVDSRSTRQRTLERGTVLLHTSETHQILFWSIIALDLVFREMHFSV